MPTFGPWVQPPNVYGSMIQNGVGAGDIRSMSNASNIAGNFVYTGPTDDLAVISEGGGNTTGHSGGVGIPNQNIATTLFGRVVTRDVMHPVWWILTNSVYAFDIAPFSNLIPAVQTQVPSGAMISAANATGYELESEAWIAVGGRITLSFDYDPLVDFVPTNRSIVRLRIRRVTEAHYTVTPDTWTSSTGKTFRVIIQDEFLPGTLLASLPLLAEVNLTTFIVPVITFTESDLDANGLFAISANLKSQEDYVPPFTVGPSPIFNGETTFKLSVPYMEVLYRPPRYRYVFADQAVPTPVTSSSAGFGGFAPPLRQYQRW